MIGTQQDLTVRPGDTVIVWTAEWVTVFARVSGPVTDPGARERTAAWVETCQRYRAAHYAGRVPPEATCMTTERMGEYDIIRLKVFLPVVRGEFKSLADAVAWAHDNLGGAAHELVVRGSARDRQMNMYGSVMLPVA